MSRVKITQKMPIRFIQEIADMQSFQRESFGNQDGQITFVDISLDGIGNKGMLIIGCDLAGSVTSSSIYIMAKTGGGIDFFNGSNIKIASLDLNGNLRLKGTITQNTTP